MTVFSPLLDVLADVPDPRRAEGKLYKLPHVLLFSILAIVAGCNLYRGIVTFVDVHRRKLNAAFGLTWKRSPAHTAIRDILQGLDPAGVEAAFRRHAALLQAARSTPGQGCIALDGKTLRGSVEPRGSPDFDKFRDRAAAQMLSAFATDTALVLAHIAHSRANPRAEPHAGAKPATACRNQRRTEPRERASEGHDRPHHGDERYRTRPTDPSRKPKRHQLTRPSILRPIPLPCKITPLGLPTQVPRSTLLDTLARVGWTGPTHAGPLEPVS